MYNRGLTTTKHITNEWMTKTQDRERRSGYNATIKLMAVRQIQ